MKNMIALSKSSFFFCKKKKAKKITDIVATTSRENIYC